MKLYTVIGRNAAGQKFIEHTSSAGDASKAKTRLKKEGIVAVVEDIEINTDRQSLIRYMNKLMAHSSWVPVAMADTLS